MAHSALVLGVLILLCVAYWKWGPPLFAADGYRWDLERAAACLGCHQDESEGLFADWSESRHARAGVSCLYCHQAAPGDADVSLAHFSQYDRPNGPGPPPCSGRRFRPWFPPRDCARCHPREVDEFGRSKHAFALEIARGMDPVMTQGLASPVELAAGCLDCHGSEMAFRPGPPPPGAGRPNTGIGRINPDGSRGACNACHGRHHFLPAEARKAEACGRCHVGPDHPQLAIYKESKHGALYDAFGPDWNWDAPAESWTPGVDYRAPTCAACHMSGTGLLPVSHNASRRLAWELQAPLTVRPEHFAPFPAPTDWPTERAAMKSVCRPCHGPAWTDGHFERLDRAVIEYNEVYYLPAKNQMDRLYECGLLDREVSLDEPEEIEFEELWRRDGRRARMGAAMMAPDYSWWHGFYEAKLRYNRLAERARDLLSGRAEPGGPRKIPNAPGPGARP